eukprot:115374-Rhodomonas_salina.2
MAVPLPHSLLPYLPSYPPSHLHPLPSFFNPHLLSSPSPPFLPPCLAGGDIGFEEFVTLMAKEMKTQKDPTAEARQALLYLFSGSPVLTRRMVLPGQRLIDSTQINRVPSTRRSSERH